MKQLFKILPLLLIISEKYTSAKAHHISVRSDNKITDTLPKPFLKSIHENISILSEIYRPEKIDANDMFGIYKSKIDNMLYAVPKKTIINIIELTAADNNIIQEKIPNAIH